TFQDHLVTSDVRYIAIEESRLIAPTRVELAPEGEDLWPAQAGAEMLVIAPEVFAETLEPYLSWREGSGVSTRLVLLEDIHHQFGAGRRSPDAVRAFIRRAVAAWTPPVPSTVLLVGDGTWDHRNALGGNPLENQVPAALDFNVDWGLTASDNGYALLSDEGLLPELAIGRWTVRTVDELEGVIEKTMAYADGGEWRRRVELIGGDGSYFRTISEEFIEQLLPPHLLPQRVYTTEDAERDPDPHYRGGRELTDDLDGGVLLANFQGHGGGGIWSDADLFDMEDVPLLRNGARTPVILSLTCYTGSYAVPGPAAIGESFLVEPGRGAVAFIGSSGLSYQTNGANLDRALLRATLGEEGAGRPIGESLVAAKHEFYVENDGLVPRDMVRSYNLLGDPSVVPVAPQGRIGLELDPAVASPGIDVTVSGTVPSADYASATVTLHDADDLPVDEAQASVGGDRAFEATLHVPATATPSRWTVRVHAASSSEDAFGGRRLGIAVPVVATLRPDPDPPRADDPILVRTAVDPGAPHDRFRLVWSINSRFLSPDTLELIPDGAGGELVTDSAIPAQPGGRVLFLRVLAEGGGADPWEGSVESINVLHREDLSFADASRGTFGGTRQVSFGVDIGNPGQVPVEGAEVLFGWLRVERGGDQIGGVDPPRSGWKLFEGDSRAHVDVPAKGRVRAEIPWDLPSGSYRVRVEIDPDDGVAESSEVNNLRYFDVSADRHPVTPADGTGGSAPSADANLDVDVAPGGVDETSVLQVIRLPLAEPAAQEDYEVPALRDGSTGYAYQVALADTTLALRDLSVTAHLDDDGALDAALYGWDALRSKWVRVAGSFHSGTEVSAMGLGAGIYAVLDNRDQT
ncbi:MAG: C25 family cysteine peptidase, partial [Planctomycetota bacterium]|nr:C25 family cysteine peptidase [Planctomycetota bacterium]